MNASWIVGTEEGTVHLWQGHQQQWLSLSIHFPGRVTALTLSLDRQFLAIGDAAGTVALWDMSQGDCCWQRFQAHDDKIVTLVFSPDDQQIFSGSRDRTVKAWNQDGHLTMTLADHRRRVHALCVSSEGETLYSGSYDGTVRVWDIKTQTCTRVWQHSDRFIHCLTRDREGCPVVVISDTQALEVWDLEADTCRATFLPHAETLWHIGLSVDGQGLVGASQDGEIRVWSLETGQLQGQLRIDRPYEAMSIGGCTGLTESERQVLYSLGATDY